MLSFTVNNLGNIFAGVKLHNKLKNRKPPLEEEEYQAKAAATEASVKEKRNIFNINFDM